MVITLCVCNDSDGLFYCEISLFDFFNLSFDSVRNHDLVIHKDGLLYRTKEISDSNFSSGFNTWNKTPFFSPAHCGNTYSTKYVRAVSRFFDAFKRTLDAVEKLFYQSGGKFNT